MLAQLRALDERALTLYALRGRTIAASGCARTVCAGRAYTSYILVPDRTYARKHFVRLMYTDIPCAWAHNSST